MYHKHSSTAKLQTDQVPPRGWGGVGVGGVEMVVGEVEAIYTADDMPQDVKKDQWNNVSYMK